MKEKKAIANADQLWNENKYTEAIDIYRILICTVEVKGLLLR
jgi:hypothetical protein